MLKVAIVGKPNVGKSTLFNALIGRQFAITDSVAGTTRDRKIAQAKIGPLEFEIIDTAGFDEAKETLVTKMLEQTKVAIADADLCLFVVDGRADLTAHDFTLAKLLRRKNVVLVINKCEGKLLEQDYMRLGFGSGVGISAEHKQGFGELYEVIEPWATKLDRAESSSKESGEKSLSIAIIGRPNSGKSTFFNRILKQERAIVSEIAGTTRDAIKVACEFKGRKFYLIDTAGIRKSAKIDSDLEEKSSSASFRELQFAQVAVLLIDATSLLSHQDAALAGKIIAEGRALIFAINKIDLVTGDTELFLQKVRAQITGLLPEINGAAIVGISAKTGHNISSVIEYGIKAYEAWQKKIGTSALNRWLESALEKHPLPAAAKIKYINQRKIRPPTFVISANSKVPFHYKRYLINELRQSFDLTLTPIRLLVEKSENPFAHIRKKKFSKKLHEAR